MRRDGRMYVCCARFGGAGSEGVGGGGAEGGSRVVGARLRGISLGNLALRSGGAAGAPDEGAGCVCVMRSVNVCLVCWRNEVMLE